MGVIGKFYVSLHFRIILYAILGQSAHSNKQK